MRLEEAAGGQIFFTKKKKKRWCNVRNVITGDKEIS